MNVFSIGYSMKLKALSKDEHKELRLNSDRSLGFISKLSSMAITIADLALLSSRLPVAFLKKEEGFELSLICGVDASENLAVSLDNRKWNLGPFPSLYQFYPFVLAKKDDKFILCFDESSDRLSKNNNGEKLFDAYGELSKTLKNIFVRMQHAEQLRAKTEGATQALEENGLLEEHPLELNIEGVPKKFSGLYKVAEDKLNNLSDENFLHLRRAMALPIIYLQLSSLQNVSILARLYNLRQEERKKTGESISGFRRNEETDAFRLSDEKLIKF